MSLTSAVSRPIIARWLLAIIVGLLAAEVAYHAWGVLQDSVAALRYPYRLDYGEGIVWQQALLMFGPQMYSPSPDLPFIVFHYPPLYHFIVRALLLLQLDPLFAGRLISGLSTAASSICIVALALFSIRGRPSVMQWALAITFGLLFLCFTPVRTWGIWMRVDMLAVFLGLAATVVAARSRFGSVGTLVALLLSLAAVFTKQTHLPAGLSIFAVGLLCARRNTLVAAMIVGAVGIACVAILEASTHGFLRNIITYNINPVKWSILNDVIWFDRDNVPYRACMCVAAVIVTLLVADKSQLERLRQRDQTAITRYLTIVHFWIAFAFVLQIIKDGASNNYFLDLLGTGCVLLAIVTCEIAVQPVRAAIFAVVIALTTSNIPYRSYFKDRLADWAVDNERLVQEIRASPKPVSSDDMVLLLRAGKPIIFEPAIVRVLTASGAWDPSALLQMFHKHEFSMAITANNAFDEAGPQIRAAILADYPIVKRLSQGLAVHLPASERDPPAR